MKVTSTFEIERVHEEVAIKPAKDDRATMASCRNIVCSLPHEWAVYKRVIEGPRETAGPAMWQSDHDTFELAQLAARAYGGQTDYFADLIQQLSAAIMDCLAIKEVRTPEAMPEVKYQHESTYPWGNDRSQIYVDVARMARETADAWETHKVAGVIYEVSEAIADACIKDRAPIDAAAIDGIVKGWEGTADE